MPRTLRGMAHPTPRIAALAFELTSTDDGVQLLPAGEFRAVDGRPSECKAWQLTAEIAAQVIARAAARSNRLVIDYEHQTLNAAKNGQPAPASGWFKALEWREGVGLFAIDVDWTARAADMIGAREYRYLSAVFTYDKHGRVIEILHAALTNNPALDGMDEVSLAALSRLASLSHNPSVTEEDPTMDELIEQLRWLLSMPVGSTADDITAQLNKVINQLSGGQGTAAASVNLLELLTSKDTQIAALSANQVDPARFVPLDAMRELQTQVAALTAQLQGGEVDKLVVAALSDGRLLPAMETWARGLGKTNLPALQDFLTTAQPIAALTRTQTQGIPPIDAPKAASDADLIAVCSQLGLNAADFQEAK
ncbi:phage protease [Neisseriaceae bacterium JH1-16]|nr:phage protease [Neisseriaceae bacterium JH1-16]